MPITIPIQIETETASKETKEWVQQQNKELELKVDLDPSEAKQGLKEIGDSASRTAHAVEGIQLADVMEKAVGHIGDVKDILQKTGVALLGFSEQTVEMIGTVGDLAEKGAALGSAFGPWGAAIGGVTGALVGYVTATEDATEATKKLAVAERERREQIARDKKAVLDATTATIEERAANLQRAAEIAISGDEFGVAGKSLEQLTDRWLDNAEAMKKTKAAIDSTVLTISELKAAGTLDDAAIKARNEELERYTGFLAEEQREQKAITATMGGLTAGTKDNTDSLKAHTAAVKEDAESVSAWLAKTLAAKDESAPRRELERQAGERTVGDTAPHLVGARNRDDNKALGNPTITPEQAAATQAAYDESIQMYASYVSAFTAIGGELTAQLEANIAAGNGLFTGMGIAAEHGVSQVLKALGKMWAAQAIGEIASGIAAIANPAAAALKGETAAGHFLAAAKFGAAAVAAGIGGAVLGGDSTRRGNEAEDKQSGGAGGGSNTGAGSRFSDPGPREQSPIIVYLGGGPGSTNILTATGEEAKAQGGAIVQDMLDANGNAGPKLKR
jgi:hypothetical protein